MTRFSSNRKIRSMVLAAVIGMVAVIGCAGPGARAADDEEPELLDTKIFRGLLKGLGLRRDGEGIEYRERSPLVLPPSQELPRPEVDNPAKTAGWPDDPDIKRDKQRREAERKRKPVEPGVDDRPLLPNQYSINAPAARGSKAGEAPGRTAEDAARPSTNAELGSKGFKEMFGSIWSPKEQYVPFTGEPARTSLIDPPPGYRTPSPTQPYGVGKDRWVAPVIDKNEPVK